MAFNILKHKTIASINMFVMVLMFLLVILVTIFVFYGEYNDFDKDAKVIKKEYIKTQKDTIQFDTKRVLKFINYMYDKRDPHVDEEVVKKQIIDSVEQLYGRQDGTGYIFIYDYNGVVISDPIQRQNIGKNLYNIEDVNGVKVIKELIDISKSKDGGYIEYSWLKPTTSKPSPKVSYAKSFKPWEWMIGTGVYLDDVEDSIEKQRDALKQKVTKYMIDILFLLSILFTFGVMGIVIANNILKREIDSFTKFFQKAAKSHSLIDIKNVRLIEFKKMVHYINAMVGIIDKRTQTLQELNATLETKVEEKTQDLENLVKAQDSFIKHSIHEINTPLAVIMTNVDLFKMKKGDNKYLSKIEAGSKIISNIYEDLSYMVKKNRFVYMKKNLDMSQFLLDRVEFFSEIATGNQHKILTNIKEDIFITFAAEELQRIIDNNLSNAIKYANRSTDIILTLIEDENEVTLKFTTNSKQIEDTTSIFNEYKREDDVKGGFGLGLQIIESICRKENVRIELESNEKETTFSYIFKKES